MQKHNILLCMFPTHVKEPNGLILTDFSIKFTEILRLFFGNYLLYIIIDVVCLSLINIIHFDYESV